MTGIFGYIAEMFRGPEYLPEMNSLNDYVHNMSVHCHNGNYDQALYLAQDAIHYAKNQGESLTQDFKEMRDYARREFNKGALHDNDIMPPFTYNV